MPTAPRPTLPPLNALRAFEAAARLLSFTRAAAELHVTQAAISHQVKALETHLAVLLFQRRPRQLLLTDAGQALARALADAFDRIAAAAAQATAVPLDPRRILTVSVIPSFAARWLVPRLGRFRAAHPAVDVRVVPSTAPADFAHEDVDVGIRFGHGRYPGLRTDPLMQDELFPVCAPALARGRDGLRRPAQLAGHTLLHDERHDDWRAWLAHAGLRERDVDAKRGPIFTDASMLVEAAIAGQGVALARRVLAQDALDRGRLVRPFAASLTLPADRAYYLVAPRATAEQPKIRAFRAWLIAECGASARASPRARRGGRSGPRPASGGRRGRAARRSPRIHRRSPRAPEC